MRNSSLQTQVAILIIVLLAGTLTYLSTAFVVEILAVGLAIAGVSGWKQPLNRLQLVVVGVFLFGIFAAKWFVWPVNARAPLFSLGHAATEFLLLFQALLFVVWKGDSRPGPLFLPLGVGVLLGIGLIPEATTLQIAVYQALVLSFVILAAIWSAAHRHIQREPGHRSSRGLRTTILGLTVLLATGTSAIGSLMVQRHWREIELFMNEKFKLGSPWSGGGMMGLVGFSRQRESAIGSVTFLKTAQPNQVALRVTGNRPPGYLRGMAYETYHSDGSGIDSWLVSRNQPRRRLPTTSYPPSLPQSEPWEQLFLIRSISGAPDRKLEVWPETPTDAVFTELTTNYVLAPLEAVRVDEHEVVDATDQSQGGSYQILGNDPSDPPRISDELRQRLLIVPPQLTAEFADLQRSIFAKRDTPLQKIAAIEEYFDHGFKYNLGIAVPPGQTPMRYFLREKPPAHCEYYATATVLLLRMAGVPARYVTGYLAGSEYNHLGGYWIVRNEHAHAWAEAYIDGEGWRIVETTPSEGVPQQASDPQVSHLWDNVFLKMVRIRSLLTRGGGRATFQAIWILFTALFTTLPGLAVTAILSAILYRLFRPFWNRNREVVVVSRHVVEMRRLLAKMDRKLKGRLLARQPGETLHQFAARVQQAATEEADLQPVADWYRAWAATRFGRPLDKAQIENLRTAAKSLGI